MAKSVISVSRLADYFGMFPYRVVDKKNEPTLAKYGEAAYKAAKQQGASDHEAEIAREQAEIKIGNECYREWNTSVVQRAVDILALHGLQLSPEPDSGSPPSLYEVLPVTTWRDAAWKVAATLGVTPKEFLKAGGAPKTAVLSAIDKLTSREEVTAEPLGFAERALSGRYRRATPRPT